MGLLAALQFLTILPFKLTLDSKQTGRAAAWFPFVGLLIGLFLVFLHFILRMIFPDIVVNILLIVALSAVSGGLHLDGFADTMDGMAGHRTPEQRLEIMRDSRIGAIGAVGLFLLLITQLAALNSIPVEMLPLILLSAPMISRWAMVNAIYAFPYARVNGLGMPFKQSITSGQYLIATLVATLVMLVLFPFSGIIVFLITWLIVTLAALFLKSRLNGLTGDNYGAINELAFTTVLLIMSSSVF